MQPGWASSEARPFWVKGDYKMKNRKDYLITDILQVCKVSELSTGEIITTGELFFSLAAMSESELIKVANELNINTDYHENKS